MVRGVRIGWRFLPLCHLTYDLTLSRPNGYGSSMSNILVTALSRHERTTISDSVYADIKALLLSGRIPPGEKLTLRGLAEVTGTSPMPIRDAVRRLVTEGALEMRPNRTLRVPLPTLDAFREIVKVRCSLEGLAAQEAAARMDNATLKTVREHLARFAAEGQRRNPVLTVVVESNRLAHFTVYEAAGMPLLVNMIEGLWARVAPVFAYSMSHQTRDVRSWEAFDHHKRLLQALRQRDGVLARQAVVSDIQDAATFIEQATLVLQRE